MLAEVFIDELQMMTIIGCNPEERVKKQPLIISLAYQYDIQMAATSDDVAAAIDYDFLSQKIISFVEQSSFQLIETLAERCVDFIFEETSIQKITLFVYKPDAVKRAKRVGIKINRERKSAPQLVKDYSLSWE